MSVGQRVGGIDFLGSFKSNLLKSQCLSIFACCNMAPRTVFEGALGEHPSRLNLSNLKTID